jgi:hypothetical protein
MAKKQPIIINARVAAEALRGAEELLEQPPKSRNAPVHVHVKPKDIQTMQELFQPRRFSAGLREVDPKHVKDLATRITRKGELDPVLVVKLTGPYGSRWVCVDGHHRVAAYKSLRRTETIKCEWFAGTLREATDESLQRNEVAKLGVPQADRFEEAWRRTLNGWGSKRDVVTLTGTSDGMVAMMRRVMKYHWAQDTPKGQGLRAELGSDLRVHSWSRVRAAWVGLTPEEWSIEEEAAKLARILSNRLTNKLSQNPEVTARALWIYDPDLCGNLVGALQDHMREQAEKEREELKLAYEEK